MAAARAKGTVTSLSSMFSEEDAQRASERVQETIAEKSGELDELRRFAADNTALVGLVQRLPDDLHHHVMVPFGKAAFFPGRLVHTNEFLVLLGEGYYAERTAKQTVDILKRRGKTLNSQVDSVRAVIEDLKAEASFFERTASEAAEGLVEIREEYVDDDSEEGMSTSDAQEVSTMVAGPGNIDDEEYARIMSKMDELEREELEAEDGEVQEDDEEEKDDDVDDENSDSLLENRSLLSGHRDETSRSQHLMHALGRKPAEEYISSTLKTSIPSSSKSKPQMPVQMPKADAGSQMSKPSSESLKAFTGSIIERTDNLLPNPEKQPSNSQPSKPLSRFKMLRS